MLEYYIYIFISKSPMASVQSISFEIYQRSIAFDFEETVVKYTKKIHFISINSEEWKVRS